MKATSKPNPVSSHKYNLHDDQDAGKFWDNEYDPKHDPLGLKALKKVDLRFRGAHCFDMKHGYTSTQDASFQLD